jgi:hypothetical protein
MSVRGFLITYLGFVAMLGVAAAATVQVLKQRHVAPVSALASRPAVPFQPEVTQRQQTAALAPPAAPVERLAVPRLVPHYSAPQQARAHASKLRHAGSTTFAARSAPRWSPPSGPNIGPHYGFDPYVVGWPPRSPIMMPRPVQSYPYYPYNPGYYGYYPRVLYYRSY